MANAADGDLGDWLQHKEGCKCTDCRLERAEASLRKQEGAHIAAMAEKEAEIERLKAEMAKPKCPECNSVGLSHCSDPLNCGGIYWPDHLCRTAQQQIETLRGALIAIRNGAKLMVPEPQQSAFVRLCSAALAATATEKEKQ